MWSWLGYTPTPDMPRGAFPLLAKLAMGRAEGLHAWESLWRMGVDCGRTEGAIIASAGWLALVLFVLLTTCAVCAVARFMRK